MEVPEHLGVLVMAVDAEVFRDAGPVVEPGEGRGLVDRVFGHLAVRRPLPAGDRDEAGRGDVEGVVAREGCRPALFVGRADERAEAGERAADIGRRRVFGEIAGGMFEQER